MLHLTKNVKKRILGSVVAVTISVSVIGTALYMDGNKAHAARVTLRGIQELANAHSEGSDEELNPFVIIEVVDDYHNARLGYLVGGEEPVDVTDDYAKAIKDMPSKDERESKLRSFGTSVTDKYLDGKAYAWSADEYTEAADASSSMEIRGDFNDVGDGNGNYRLAGATDGVKKISESDYNIETDNDDKISADELQMINDAEVIIYREMSNYTLSDITEIKITDGDGLPIADPGGRSGVFNYQTYTKDKTISSYSELTEGLRLYAGAGDTLTYVGTIESNTTDTDGKITIHSKNANGDSKSITVEADGNTVSGDTGDLLTGINFVADFDWNDTPICTIKATNDNSAEGGYYIITAATGGDTAVKQINGSPGSYTSEDVPDGKSPYYVGGGLISDYAYAPGENYAFTADYTKKIYETFKYNGGFENYEWLKQFVFDRNDKSEYEKLTIDVVTIRADKLTVSDIEKADLVYLNYLYEKVSETEDKPASREMSEDVANAIINGVKDQSLPVMMEYAMYYAALAADGTANPTPNLLNVAKSLTESTVGSKDGKTEDISFAKNTLFVNDNLICGSIVGGDFDEEYKTDKINSGFTAVKQENEAEYRYIELQNTDNAGEFVQHVSKATSIRYILNKNTNRTNVKDKLRILDIEPFDVSQYNENATGDDEANPLKQLYYNGQTHTNVTSYESRDHMTKDWVVNNLGFTGGADNIDIRMIGTKEFIGINDDLNAGYDLIYIGMDKAMLSTPINGSVKTSGETKYNRSSMNGLVYSHIGDEYYHFDNVRFGEPRNATITASGNDITPDKLRELKEYIRAGYAVILSDGFFTSDGKINTVTVDSSSRMYQLMDWLFNTDEGRKYLYKNVVKRSSLEASDGGYETNRSMFSTYLNVAKLEINELTKYENGEAYDTDILSLPKAYDGTQDGYLNVESDGYSYLRFKVNLRNNSAIDTSEQTTYDCNVYIDMDADGKYEEIEKLDGVVIDGEEESDGHFHLTSGHTYNISRVVPEGYVGFLPWKIEFVQNGRTGDSFAADAVRKSIVGYSAVKLVGSKPVIDVLQIVQSDVDPNGATSRAGYTLNLNDDTFTNPTTGLYAQINEFDVKVYQTNAENYITKKNLPNLGGSGYFDGTYYDFLAQFDIVVLGFADMYGFNSPTVDNNGWAYVNGARRNRADLYKDAALGIREYALSGRSMLFTHDLTHSSLEDISSYSRNTNPGHYLNTYLRDVMGMDRYGYTVGDSSKYKYSFDSSNTIKDYQVVTDTNTLKGSTTGDTYGFTDPLILTRIRPNNGGYNGGYPNADNKYAINAKWASNIYMHSTEWNETIQSINRGQITQYPFNIPEEVTVAPTHSQYYQLDMDTDSTDNYYDDDIVVWYALSNDNADGNDSDNNRDHRYYRAVYKDVRNNYYIYTKGNITYTGAGHRLIEADRLDERKLFVNTLVASYAAGAHSPKLIYKENPWDSSATIASTYVPYDSEFVRTESADTTGASDGGFLDTQLTVNFKTMNSNIRSATSGLKAKYYVPVTSGGDITVSGVQYKEITPTSIKITGTDGQLTDAGDAYNLRNFRVYQATFNLSDFNLSGTGVTLSRDNARLVIRLSMDDFKTIENGSLPAEESLNELDIYATRLFDLE